MTDFGCSPLFVLFITSDAFASLTVSYLSVISEVLGHNSESTAQIYLRSLQSSEVDDANAKILAAIMNESG